jgi:Tc toxin complex TcA C-terminal TcB-binding domain
VTGPYVSVNCTLTLRWSRIRTTAVVGVGEFKRSGPEDPRLADYYGSIQSIVTSTAQDD